MRSPAIGVRDGHRAESPPIERKAILRSIMGNFGPNRETKALRIFCPLNQA